MTFQTAIERLVNYAANDPAICAVIECGAPKEGGDIVLACRRPEEWLYGKLPAVLGELRLICVDRDGTCFPALKILLDDAVDIKLMVATPDSLKASIENCSAQPVFCHGYAIRYDAMDIGKFFAAHADLRTPPRAMSKAEFLDVFRAFWFEAVRAGHAILHENVWAATTAVNGDLKIMLLRVMESVGVAKRRPVCHGGRDLSLWVDERPLAMLSDCYANPTRSSLISALLHSADLFEIFARQYAETLPCAYPVEEQQTAREFLEMHFLPSHTPPTLVTTEKTLLRYRSEDGLTDIPVIVDAEGVWLSLPAVANLVQLTETTVKSHVAAIYRTKRYDVSATTRLADTEDRGQIPYYHLDIVIDIGYRILSLRVSYFRVWLSHALKELSQPSQS